MNAFLHEVKEAYYQKDSFRHRTPTRARLFPYVTNPSPSLAVKAEFVRFSGVVGACCRRLTGQELETPCTPDSMADALRGRVEGDSFVHLAHVIKEVAFDDGHLVFFSPDVLPYLTFREPVSTLDTIARFVGDVLLQQDAELLPSGAGHDKSGNALVSLILAGLPALGDAQIRDGTQFMQLDVGLTEVIAQDLSFLRDAGDAVCCRYLPELLKFYTFMYQARCIEQLNAFFSGPPARELYFSVDWESLSKGRQAYQGGWRRISGKLDTIFSHVNCLELLSYVPFPALDPPFSYTDIRDWAAEASPEQRAEVLSAMNALIAFYREGIAGLGFNWSPHDPKLNARSGDDDPILQKVRLLFELVHCQFMESGRKSRAQGYAKWFRDFAAGSFLKDRGRIGYTLALRREQLMLLTRLCIGDREKLCLRDLWKELRRRGVLLDSDTRREVAALFDRLSILEKKSDSGDAQYVRTSF